MNRFIVRQTLGMVAGWALVSTALSAAESSVGPGWRLQEADDVLSPLAPIKPRTPALQSRLEAISRYATGRLLEQRGQSKEALEQYFKAVELDPEAVEVYRSLVPLAIELDRAEEAIRYAIKAAELDPDDYELQLRIGAQFAAQQDFASGLKYLEQALKSSKLDKESPTFVMLNIELGKLYQVTGQPQKAADAYAVVFDAIKNPQKYELDFRARSALLSNAQTSYERIGQVLMAGGRLELAWEAFEAAAKANRASAGNLTFYRARIHLLSDKAEEALAELQKYFDEQRQSKGREAYQLLADILKKLNRSDELVGRLEALAEKDPRNNQLQYAYADTLMEAGELERAKRVYEAVLSGGGDAPGFLGLAGVLRRMKRADELLDVLGRGLSKLGQEGLDQFDTELKAVVADAALVDALLAAGRAQSKAEPPQLSFEEAYLLAKVGAELKRFEDASEFFKLAVALDMDRRVLAYRDWVGMLMEADRFAEAADVYAEAIKIKLPPELKAQFLLGLTQAREYAGQTEAALEAIAEARREFPHVPLFEFYEGWVYYHSRQFDEAIKRFQQILETHAGSNDANLKKVIRQCQFSLSAIYVQQGEIRKGEEILEVVFKEEPENPSVNNDLGYLYADQGKNLEQAEVMIRKAVKSEPENAAYLDSLGWVLFKLGKTKEAIEPLEKATAIPSGGDGTIWEHLGDCYHKLSQLDKAVSAWEKGLEKSTAEKYPDDKLVERLKMKLMEHRPKPGTPKPATPDKP
ncbi:MAG: tetratricopeptide repeat protein [Planctomycetaceae bacterium]|nr:tetratricopeptide repeat protein [Planctomycetaceae bacterium]